MDLRPVDGLTAARTSRRAVLSLLGVATAWPTGLQAQDADKPARFAFLAAGGAPRPGSFSTIDAVVAGLRERGQSHIVHQSWFADGRAERLPALVQQLLQWQPDPIVTLLTPAAAAAAQATRSVPIIMDGAGDPVAAGLVQSLARPRGKITGVAALGPELGAKSVEVLRELRPGLRRLGVLAHATDPFTPALLQQVEAAAAQLGLQLQVDRVRGAAQYEAVFESWLRQRAVARHRGHRMKRCARVARAVGRCTLPAVRSAQADPQVRIGLHSPTSAAANHARLAALRTALAELGYEEGRNLLIEYRYAEGHFERLPEMAREPAAASVSPIIAINTPTAVAAARMPGSTPVLFASVGDPVAIGLVRNLSRPGGTVNGTTNMARSAARRTWLAI